MKRQHYPDGGIDPFIPGTTTPRRLYPDYAIGAIESIDLERRTYARAMEIDKRELASMTRGADMRVVEQEMANRLRFELRMDVYGRKHEPVQLIRFPKTWLDAVKHRFAPKWILDRWPVEFAEVSTALDEVYPEIEPSLPDHRAILRVNVLRSPNFPQY